MKLLIGILLIAIITVFVIDLSGAIEHLVKPLVKRVLHLNPKSDIEIPLVGCSLCVTFWSGLAYLILTGSFGLPGIAIVSIVSFLTPIIKDILVLLKDTFIRLIDLIYLVLKI